MSGSSGAIFNLQLKDSRVDRFLTASELLRSRLKKIKDPTFDDVSRTHNLYLYNVYKPHVSITSEYSRAQTASEGSYLMDCRGGATFTFNIFGHFTSDMAVHVRVRSVGNPNSDTAPLLRYCAYPGIRMFNKVEFKSDQILIDDYTADDVLLWANHFVQKDHKQGWDRLMGQQEIKEANYYNGNGYTGVMYYKDGPQTPKQFHDEFDMFIPLHFDMCRDPEAALPNHLIPNSQRTINIELARIADIIQAVDQFGNRIDLPFNRLQVDLTLYINGLYVNPEVHSLLVGKTLFKLIRMHRRQVSQLQTSSENVLLDKLKFPTEYILGGFRGVENKLNFDTWCLMGRKRIRENDKRLLLPAVIWNNSLNLCQLVCREGHEVSTLDPLVTEIGLVGKGVDIFKSTRMPFYNSYLQSRYTRNTNLCAVNDTSVFLIPFCLFPGRTETSGYYNLSADRELYLTYQAPGVDQDSAIELVLSSSALNFLIGRDDSVSLLLQV